MQKILIFFLFIGFTLQAKEQPIAFSLATAELPPYVTVNKDEHIEGLFVDILNKVQHSTGIKIKIFVMPWGRAVNEVKKGSIDAIMPALWSKERAQYLAYPTLPFYHFSRSVLIKRIEDDFVFTHLSHINPLTVIGKTRSVMVDEEFDKLVKQGKLSIYETNTLDQVLLMLAQKKVDLVASDGDIARDTIKQLTLDNRFILFPMHKDAPPSFIAFSRQFSEKHDINKIMSLINEGHKHL